MLSSPQVSSKLTRFVQCGAVVLSLAMAMPAVARDRGGDRGGGGGGDRGGRAPSSYRGESYRSSSAERGYSSPRMQRDARSSGLDYAPSYRGGESRVNIPRARESGRVDGPRIESPRTTNRVDGPRIEGPRTSNRIDGPRIDSPRATEPLRVDRDRRSVDAPRPSVIRGEEASQPGGSSPRSIDSQRFERRAERIERETRGPSSYRGAADDVGSSRESRRAGEVIRDSRATRLEDRPSSRVQTLGSERRVSDPSVSRRSARAEIARDYDRGFRRGYRDGFGRSYAHSGRHHHGHHHHHHSRSRISLSFFYGSSWGYYDYGYYRPYYNYNFRYSPVYYRPAYVYYDYYCPPPVFYYPPVVFVPAPVVYYESPVYYCPPPRSGFSFGFSWFGRL